MIHLTGGFRRGGMMAMASGGRKMIVLRTHSAVRQDGPGPAAQQAAAVH